MEGKLKINAVKTISPMKPTDPRKSVNVSLLENVGSSIYKTCFNLIFCYKISQEEETGSLVAGWIKETLGMALDQKPILAGRLRQQQEESSGEGEMEIVSNDSGIRLIEAQIDVTLQEFLDLKKKNQNKDFEDDDVLVFWKDIDHEINPQFSPLFYIQVTNFKSGGYSVGISCSLILIDPLSLINFLKSWTKIHLQLISNSTNTPVFYRHNHGTTNYPYMINQTIGQSTKKTCNSQTSIFNIMDTKILNNNNIHKNLAEMCIYEAEKKNGIKPISRFVVYVKDESSKNVKIMKFDKEDGMVEKKQFISMNEINYANLDDICFIKDNKAVYCSSWINVVDDEAVVIVLPSLEDDGYGMKIIATLPVES